MLPVKVQHPDGVIYSVYHATSSLPKGIPFRFYRNSSARATKFINQIGRVQRDKLMRLLHKPFSDQADIREILIGSFCSGELKVFQDEVIVDNDDADLARLRQEIKNELKIILSIETDESQEIEKSLEEKNILEKVLIYKQTFDKGVADAAISLLTWVKDVYDVVSPTENLKRAIEAGWDTYNSDSKNWQTTFTDKLLAANYKEVIEALGFDPSKLTNEQVAEIFKAAQLIWEDEDTRDIVLKFVYDYAGAQHSLEWTSFAGSAAFDIILTALLAVFTGGVGAVASIGSKARLIKPLMKLGEKFLELAKKLAKKYKPKKKPKTKVGGSGKQGKPTSDKNKKNERDSEQESIQSRVDKGKKVPKHARENPDAYYYDASSGKYKRKPEPKPDLSKGKGKREVPCFMAGTLVETMQGMLPIECLDIGTKVQSSCNNLKEKILSGVTDKHNNKAIKWVRIKVGSDAINATRKHRFWVEGLNQWVEAKYLRAGMALLNSDGEKLTIDEVEDFETKETDTYNITVEDTHTYYVGASKLLVHNEGEAPTGKVYIGYDKNNNPIYVGQTKQPLQTRQAQHIAEGKSGSASKAWKADMTIRTVPGMDGLTDDQMDYHERRIYDDMNERGYDLKNSQVPLTDPKINELEEKYC